MKKLIPILILSLAVSIPVALQAQQWSDQQKEVWKNVEAYTDYLGNGELEKSFPYFHDDFVGWINDDYLPTDKSTRENFIRFFHSKNTVLFWEIQPLAISIHGNVAIVHYTYSGVFQNNDGEESSILERWTDVLLKEGDKWVMIADHGGVTSQK